MHIDWRFAVRLIGALLLPAKAFAFGAVLLYEGEVDDRTAYFADLRYVANKTLPDQLGGPVEIREIPVTAVYESASKPEFVSMRLQFKCPQRYVLDAEHHPVTENKSVQPVRAGDAVNFRIGPGSYKLRRADLQTEPVPESDWKTSSAPMLSRAGTIACNHIEVQQALHASIKGTDFDFPAFGQRIAALGLPADMALIGETLPSEVLQFAWENFWFDKVLDHKRPDPSGKWGARLSAVDKAMAMESLKQKHRQLEAATASMHAALMAKLKGTDAEFKADTAAAKNADKHPDGSKMNRWELKLAKALRGQSERVVVDLMGRPEVSQADGARFLRFTAWWEQRGVTVYGAQGVIGGDPGGYAECWAEFRLKPDANRVWWVDDVRVRGDYDGQRGSSRLQSVCDDLVHGRP